jgi:hypothetical protein
MHLHIFDSFIVITIIHKRMYIYIYVYTNIYNSEVNNIPRLPWRGGGGSEGSISE